MPHTLQTEDGTRTRIMPGDLLLFRPQQGCIMLFRPQGESGPSTRLFFSLVPRDRSETYFPFRHGIVPNAETYFQLLQVVTGLKLVQNRTTSVRDSPSLEYVFRKSERSTLFEGNTRAETSFRPGDAVLLDIPSNSLVLLRAFGKRNSCVLVMRSLQDDAPMTMLRVSDLSDWTIIIEAIALSTGYDMEREKDGVRWTARVPQPALVLSLGELSSPIFSASRNGRETELNASLFSGRHHRRTRHGKTVCLICARVRPRPGRPPDAPHAWRPARV